jgi:hypothetical protein
MISLIKKLNKYIDKKKIMDVTLFDDEYLKTFDEPFIIQEYNNTKCKYTINEHFIKEHDIKNESNISENAINIKKYFNKLQALIKKSGTILQESRSYKSDYSEMEKINIINLIKTKYNINNIHTVYSYTSSQLPFFGALDKKMADTLVNTLITKSESFYMLYFSMNSNIYEKNIYGILKYIIDVINLLNIDGNIIIYTYFAPFGPNMFSLYMLFLNCFSKVAFIYSKWHDTLGNNVFIVLQNKKSNIEYDNNLKNIKVTISETSDILKIKNNMLIMANEILKFMTFSYKLTNTLYKISRSDIRLYGKLKNKILKKYIIAHTNIQ